MIDPEHLWELPQDQDLLDGAIGGVGRLQVKSQLKGCFHWW